MDENTVAATIANIDTIDVYSLFIVHYTSSIDSDYIILYN